MTIKKSELYSSLWKRCDKLRVADIKKHKAVTIAVTAEGNKK